MTSSRAAASLGAEGMTHVVFTQGRTLNKPRSGAGNLRFNWTKAPKFFFSRDHCGPKRFHSATCGRTTWRAEGAEAIWNPERSLVRSPWLSVNKTVHRTQDAPFVPSAETSELLSVTQLPPVGARRAVIWSYLGTRCYRALPSGVRRRVPSRGDCC